MAAPEFLVCLNCESACYTFEWKEDQLDEILCEICGNEEVDEFVSQEDFEALF